MNNDITIETYVPEMHKVEGLVLAQHLAVELGECQMLPLPCKDGMIIFEHRLPFFVAVVGTVALAGAGFNALYPGDVVELGGAYVLPVVRGQGIYHQLTEARVDYAASHSLDMVSFANENSYPILTSDFGFTPVSAQTAPQAAFDLCTDCNSNPHLGCPATFDTCCDKDTIVYLPKNRVE